MEIAGPNVILPSKERPKKEPRDSLLQARASLNLGWRPCPPWSQVQVNLDLEVV